MTTGTTKGKGWNFNPTSWLSDLQYYLNQTVELLGSPEQLVKVQDEINGLVQHNGLNPVNASLNVTNPDGDNVHVPGHVPSPTPILFVFGTCALGAVVRTILKKIPQLPYTVFLLVVGLLLGVVAVRWEPLAEYTTLVNVDPHTLLHIFLPVLIFESAYAMESHTFLRSFMQIIVLAVPGLFIASAMTATFCWYVFVDYEWNFAISLLFGSIISATDPVAVVALLKELGTSKQLAVLLEGESLLNDGTAIVIFNVMLDIATPGVSPTAQSIILRFFRVTFGGPIFGFLMAQLTIFWLVHIFNDALTEITITLASTYITFYIAEVFLQVSGVLAVVVLGVVLSSNRTSISPEVERFLHRFWEMLAYLANTLIFIIVGVVITEKAATSITASDVVLNLSLFCAIIVIRAFVVVFFSPLLSRIGYGLSWRNSTVMIWGGLRGAVGLTLGLIVVQRPHLDPTGQVQHKILLHTAGIVFLTLCVNASTIQPLLAMLGMSEISMPKRIAMASAVRNLQSVANTHISLYKTDRFLADADWDIVSVDIDIEDPYKTLDEEAQLDHLTALDRHSKCPTCDTNVLNEPSPKEMAEMREEARLRILKAEKISYWKQFEHGMLSRDAIRKLTELVDIAADQVDGWIEINEIRKTWEIKGFYAYLRKKLEMWQHDKPDRAHVPPPRNACMRGAYVVCLHPVFDIFMQFSILCNVISIIVELVEESNLCKDEIHAKFGDFFDISNYVFIVIYSLEAFMKILAFRKWYFRSKWNLFDFLILILSYGDMVLDIMVFSGADGSGCDSGATTSVFSPSVLRIVRSVKLLRLLRSLRLVKGIIPQMMDVVDHQINKKLRFGYDVGKGYVMGEEEVQNFIDSMIDNHLIARELKNKLSEGRLEIIKELGLLQKVHPGVAVSIKTQQASRRILNKMRDSITQMRSEGVLDDAESEKLHLMVEVRMKKLLKIPPTIHPPPPERIIGNLSWVRGDATLIEYIKHNARLQTMGDGETLQAESDPKGGLYVIISGLVKVDKFLDPYADGHSDDTEPLMISDYLTTGGVLGEMSLLTHKASRVIVTCETSVQLYHIPYDAIQAAIELFTEEPSLEYRLWRVCAIRMASVILRNQPLFRLWSQEKIQLYLDGCIIFLKKSELPEGGKFYDFPTFDINPVIMSEVLLIHGVAEDSNSGDMFLGPCFIPTRIERLILIPGKTDKHVIAILPRNTEGLLLERTKSGSGVNISGGHNTGGSLTDLCLHHASKHRLSLTHRISELQDISKMNVMDKVARSVTSLKAKWSGTDMKTNADKKYDSDTCEEVTCDLLQKPVQVHTVSSDPNASINTADIDCFTNKIGNNIIGIYQDETDKIENYFSGNDNIKYSENANIENANIENDNSGNDNIGNDNSGNDKIYNHISGPDNSSNDNIDNDNSGLDNIENNIENNCRNDTIENDNSGNDNSGIDIFGSDNMKNVNCGNGNHASDDDSYVNDSFFSINNCSSIRDANGISFHAVFDDTEEYNSNRNTPTFRIDSAGARGASPSWKDRQPLLPARRMIDSARHDSEAYKRDSEAHMRNSEPYVRDSEAYRRDSAEAPVRDNPTVWPVIGQMENNTDSNTNAAASKDTSVDINDSVKTCNDIAITCTNSATALVDGSETSNDSPNSLRKDKPLRTKQRDVIK